MTTTPTAKIMQHLGGAHAGEQAWSQTLTTHIAMTPSGSYRSILERQRKEAVRHAERLEGRLGDLGDQRGWLGGGVGVVTGLLGRAASVGKAPLGLIRGGSGEEKMLKNAKQEMASLQQAIATYRALEHLAQAVDDDTTAKLAEAVVGDKEKGLGNLGGALNGLVDAVVRSEIHGKSTYDPSTTGGAQTARRLGADFQEATEKVTGEVRTQAKQARKVPGVSQVEGELKGAVADAGDLRIANYDELTAEEIVQQMGPLSQVDLAKVDAYERKNDNRSTITGRISSLRGDEPWPGYDDQTVVEIRKLLSEADARVAREVGDYERRHKDRQGVLEATETARAGV